MHYYTLKLKIYKHILKLKMLKTCFFAKNLKFSKEEIQFIVDGNFLFQ